MGPVNGISVERRDRVAVVWLDRPSAATDSSPTCRSSCTSAWRNWTPTTRFAPLS